MPRIEINGLPVHYQQTGSGPDVILVHAFTANLAVWMFINILESLADRFRVTAYDLRGHGYSGVPKTGYTSDIMADDLFHLHQHLQLGPALVVGHSYGGVIGMHAAVKYPQMVRGIIFSDSYFPGLAHLEPNMRQADPWRDIRNALLACGADIGDDVDFGRLFKTIAAATPETMDNIKKQMGPPAVRWLSQVHQLAPTTAAEEAFLPAGLGEAEICGVTQPVVAMYDEHSPFMATCNFLKERLPRCTVEIVPGAKHLAPLENSAEFVRLVKKHLQQMDDG